MGSSRMDWKHGIENFILLTLCWLALLCHISEAKLTSEVEAPQYVLNIFPDLGEMLRSRYNKESRNGFSESSTEDSDKRGIDFGLGRGYSGSQAARHMLGLQQVNFAGGPGKRKKRSERQSIVINVQTPENN